MYKVISLLSILLFSAMSHAQCPASQEQILVTSDFSECKISELKTARSNMNKLILGNLEFVRSEGINEVKSLSMAELAAAKATISLINQEIMRKEAANR